MNTLAGRLGELQQRIARLVRDHGMLRAKVSKLEAEALEHQRMCEVLKSRVMELERENEVLRSNKTASGGPVPPGTKEKIDELVQEIDHCLALLNA
jgi:chromosome segregation ATPase